MADVIGKCVLSNPYKNGDAVIAVSRVENKVYTFPGYQSNIDPTSYSQEMSTRLNNVNYYYGTPKV